MDRLLHGADETIALGYQLGNALTVPTLLCLHGDLGAGKTHLVKGIVQGATGAKPEAVCSPTFVYLNIYNGPKTIYHFDLYRLEGAEEFLSMGFDEYFTQGICCIEWPERINDILPAEALHMTLEHCGEEERRFSSDKDLLL